MTGMGNISLSSQKLFKMVMAHECLGSVWPQRSKPGNENLVPTVHVTITQFNSVANCVVTTCLGDPSMMAWDRASVVAYWIKVARVCYGRPRGVPSRALKIACPPPSALRLQV